MRNWFIKLSDAQKILLLLVLGVLFFVISSYFGSLVLFFNFNESVKNAKVFSIYSALQYAMASKNLDYESFGRIIISYIWGLHFGFSFPLLVFIILVRYESDKYIHGKSRFATMKEITKEGLFSRNGIILGRSESNNIIRLPGNEFCILAAPTRSGKGVGFCIPNLLMFEDSAIVLDIKCENYNLTARYRSEVLNQKIFILNPYSENSHRWNPLTYISRDPKLIVTDLLLLAVVIYKENEKDPFWSDSARNLFVGLTMMVLETEELPHTLGEVLRQSSGKGFALKDYLIHIIELRKSLGIPLSDMCVGFLNRFTSLPQNTAQSVLGVFNAPLAIFGSQLVDNATSTDDFDLRDIRRVKMTVYLVMPAGQLAQAGFLFNIFFSQLINENIKALPEEDSTLKYKCLLLMDEFTAIGKINVIAKSVGFIAGYGLRLSIVIQDRAQLESTYGKDDANTILSNMGAQIYFTPSGLKDAEELSKLLGNQTKLATSESFSNINPINHSLPSASKSIQKQSKALMSINDLLTMPKTKELIVRPGIPVIFANKIISHSDPDFSSLFSKTKQVKKNVDGSIRTVPQPLDLPVHDWSLYFEQLNQSNHYIQPEFSADSSLNSEANTESDSGGNDQDNDFESYVNRQ